MNRRIVFFVSGVLGATLVAGGALAVFQASDQASASSKGQPIGNESFIADSLTDFAPGATVKRTDEGLVIVNARFSADEQAAHDRAYAALAAGPASITCADTNGALRCSPMNDDKVVAALKGGAAVYGRSAITDVERGGPVPKVEADGLTCGPTAADGTLECRPVTEVPPSVPPSSDVVIYYDRFDVAFHGGDMIMVPGPHLTVPVAAP